MAATFSVRKEAKISAASVAVVCPEKTKKKIDCWNDRIHIRDALMDGGECNMWKMIKQRRTTAVCLESNTNHPSTRPWPHGESRHFPPALMTLRSFQCRSTIRECWEWLTGRAISVRLVVFLPSTGVVLWLKSITQFRQGSLHSQSLLIKRIWIWV